MKLGRVVIGSLMLASAPLAAMADDMSYSFVDAAYVETDIDALNESADGFAVRGSAGFAENWFVFADFASQSLSGADVDSYDVGFGGHYAVNDSLDVVGRLGYTKVELDAGALNSDDDGYLLDLGLRGLVTEGVELEGGIHYTDFDEGGDDTGFYFGGRFHFNKTWAVGAEYRTTDDADSILAYVRASF
jgi:hypothetical protein